MIFVPNYIAVMCCIMFSLLLTTSLRRVQNHCWRLMWTRPLLLPQLLLQQREASGCLQPCPQMILEPFLWNKRPLEMKVIYSVCSCVWHTYLCLKIESTTAVSLPHMMHSIYCTFSALTFFYFDCQSFVNLRNYSQIIHCIANKARWIHFSNFLCHHWWYDT